MLLAILAKPPFPAASDRSRLPTPNTGANARVNHNRDRTLLASLLYLRVCTARISATYASAYMQSPPVMLRFRVTRKVRFVSIHVMAQRLIEYYLVLAEDRADVAGSLFRQPHWRDSTGHSIPLRF
jgi:hypothetical protein